MGIDPCAHRCRMAEGLGATRAFPVHSIEIIHAARQNPGEWEPPEICIEAVGHQMDTLNDCLELVRKQGTVVAFGVSDHPVYAIEFETFFRKNVHLIAVVTPEARTGSHRTRSGLLSLNTDSMASLRSTYKSFLLL